PYEQRAEFFARYSMALITFPRSLETDLSMRTRIYDYLWCGLPIVTSSAPGTDEVLTRYGAGSIVTTDPAEAFADELVAIVRDPDRYAEMVRGARTFVSEHQWPRTLEPLRAFCRAPRFESTKTEFTMPRQIVQRPPSLLHRIRRRLRA
ncbi:MAG TPA: glycosyltransferase, partial [Thermoanaerobaculia bacterium]